MSRRSIQTTLAAVGLLATAACCLAEVRVAETPQTTTRNSHYTSNREPLAPSPLVKLPIGSIVPRGWLRHQLELERDGMTGRLSEVSPWLDFGKSSWADKQGRGRFGWEEMPYWLKGYGDLGYVLKDEAVIAQARKWIEAAMNSQREDGWFGPRELLTSLGGKPDLWPHMLMLNILQSCHEATGDPRALEVMKRYMKWENTLPESAFGEGYWPKLRAGDNIESALWMYNRTGEPWLLELAGKIHRGMARWDKDVINWHNVNIAQGFRAGTVFGMLSREAENLESAQRNYQKLMTLYGQQPGGGFVGDENCRPGHFDPRGGIETCGIVEFMHSFEMLTRITGLPIWADRCEEIALNSFPAAMTPDQKGLHYITSVNQVQLDRKNKAPGTQNDGALFSYSPFEAYRCCQHNVSHGWPYYAEETWLATPDNGLCASLYAPSEVAAKVADGTKVVIREETAYPFQDTVELKLSLPRATQFPLYLRVPQWCGGATVKINGDVVDVKPKPLSFIVLDRPWADGDTVTLRLPMEIAVRRWPKNQDAVSVSYGPLAFSLAIKERWEKFGTRNAKWPEWEVFPESGWNYGLVLDARNPAGSFQLVRKDGPLPQQPFTADAVPLQMRAKAKRIPGWQMDRNQMIEKLPRSPVKSAEPVEEITLIPLGAARLRLGMFPVIGDGPDAHDRAAPANSNDHDIPRATWSRFRGPNGSGISDAKTVPARWTEKDYNWTATLPGIGHSSPVVWGHRVFVICGDPNTASRSVICLDTADGRKLWQKDYPSRTYDQHPDNSYATATPAVDDDGVVLTWTTPEDVLLVALDLEGREIWRRSLGRFITVQGSGISPIIVGDLVVLDNSQEDPSLVPGHKTPPGPAGKSFWIAVDRKTGRTRWQVDCPTSFSSYATPCLYQAEDGRTELIFTSTPRGMTGVDPARGKVLWELEQKFLDRTIASPVVAPGLVIAGHGAGLRGSRYLAVHPAENGGQPTVAYELKNALPLVPTPLVKDGCLYLWTDDGVVSCVRVASGELLWRERVGGSFYGSPVWVDHRLYCIARNGEVVVIAGGEQFKLLARVSLGEASYATPAIADGVMYLRTRSHLFSLGGASGE